MDELANQPVNTVDIVVADTGADGPNAGFIQPESLWQPVGATDAFRGRGADSTISIDPEYLNGQGTVNVLGSHGGYFQVEPDEILFHELVHARDIVNGTLTVDRQDGVLLPELSAVDETNQYRQEKADAAGETAFQREGYLDGALSDNVEGHPL